jgi:hypothetical protein
VPFAFTYDITNGLVTRLLGADTDTESAERAGVHGKVLDWLRGHAAATKTDMKKAGLGRWETITSVLEDLQKNGKVDAVPGKKKGSLRYFVVGYRPTAQGRCNRGRTMMRLKNRAHRSVPS